MREKTKVIESTQGLGNDLAGVLALQRKLAGTERDLEAIAARVDELAREADALATSHPAQAPAINARLAEVQTGWEDLRATMRRREESLGEARRLQDFLRSLDDFQAWLGRTQTAVASEETPATLPEAEALLAQHAALRGEVERAQSEYSQLRTVGEEVTRDQADPQCLFLRQRLEALGTGWEELGRMWESRQGRLAQAHGFQAFLRDARQAEGVLSSQVRARVGGSTPKREGMKGGCGGRVGWRAEGTPMGSWKKQPQISYTETLGETDRAWVGLWLEAAGILVPKGGQRFAPEAPLDFCPLKP